MPPRNPDPDPGSRKRDPDRIPDGDLSPPGPDRLRTLGRAAAAGFGLGVTGVVLPAAAGVPASDANGLVFPLAALLFGFGLATWASALLYGSTIDRQPGGRGRGDDRTSEGVAESMGVLTLFGLGGMVGGSVAALVLGAVWA